MLFMLLKVLNFIKTTSTYKINNVVIKKLNYKF